MPSFAPARVSLLLLLSFLGTACIQLPVWNPENMEARRGLFDLRTWDFQRGGPIKLSGEWEFAWGRLQPPGGATPTEDEKNAVPAALGGTQFVAVPAQWSSYRMGSGTVPVFGYATYRLRLRLPADLRTGLALRVPSTDSAYRLFVDGREAATNGRVGTRSSDSRPIRYTPHVVHLDLKGADTELIFLVSNFHYPRPGLRDPIIVGMRADILKLTEKKLAFEIFLFGAIVLISLYHFGLFLLRRSDRVALVFATLSAAVAIRILVTGESYAFELVPGLTWNISTFFEYISYYAATPLFMLFFATLYPREVSAALNRVVFVLGAAACLFVLGAPLYYYAQTVLAYHVFTLLTGAYILTGSILAVVRRRETARTFLVGLVVLFASLVHDILVTERVLDSIYVAPFGLFIFFFSHAFLLSKQFAAAFNTAESLSHELEQRVEDRTHQLELAMKQSDTLLRNILPARVADELKSTGSVRPLHYGEVSVLFSDFVGFTQLTERMPAEELVHELDTAFSAFDRIVEKYRVEKLKTMGDSYMCAGGLPEPGGSHPVRICLAAMAMQRYLTERAEEYERQGRQFWSVRIGVHTGPVTAGVIGTTKFAYDIWGDTVNTAARMESSGEPGRVNISEATQAVVSDFFEFSFRGKIQAKNKGELAMYFVERIKDGLHENGLPNAAFEALIQERFGGAAAGATGAA